MDIAKLCSEASTSVPPSPQGPQTRRRASSLSGAEQQAPRHGSTVGHDPHVEIPTSGMRLSESQSRPSAKPLGTPLEIRRPCLRTRAADGKEGRGERECSSSGGVQSAAHASKRSACLTPRPRKARAGRTECRQSALTPRRGRVSALHQDTGSGCKPHSHSDSAQDQ